MKKISAIAGLALVLAALVGACGKPQQAKLPDVEKDTGSQDMGGGEEAAAAPKDASEKPAGEAEMREKCCVTCKTSASKDRSGTPQDQLPCSDFTADLSPWCLEYFRAHPTKASECQ